MKRRRKLWSILVVCFMVLGVVAAGLPMTASAEDDATPVSPNEITPNVLAVWTLNVSYDLKGGAWEPGEEIPPYTLYTEVGHDVPVGGVKGKDVVPVKPGYVFNGWYYTATDQDGELIYDSSEIGEYAPFDMPLDQPEGAYIVNLVLWPHWERDEEAGLMHVSHDLDGGAWKSGEEVGDYDILYTPGDYIPASEFKHNSRTPEREGYTFAGWKCNCTDMDGIVIVESAPWGLGSGWHSWLGQPVEINVLIIAVWEPVEEPGEDPETPGTVEKKEPTKAEPGKVTPKTPKTGDNSPLALATLLLVGAGAATVGFGRKTYLNK